MAGQFSWSYRIDMKTNLLYFYIIFFLTTDRGQLFSKQCKNREISSRKKGMHQDKKLPSIMHNAVILYCIKLYCIVLYHVTVYYTTKLYCVVLFFPTASRATCSFLHFLFFQLLWFSAILQYILLKPKVIDMNISFLSTQHSSLLNYLLISKL